MKLAIGTLVILIFGICGLFTSAFGAEKSATPANHEHKQMTAEQRKNMADVHDKMAACLRSDTAIESCQSEMMQSCHDKMGKDGCPMDHMAHMGKMHAMKGMGKMQGHDMSDDKSVDTSSKSGMTPPADTKK